MGGREPPPLIYFWSCHARKIPGVGVHEPQTPHDDTKSPQKKTHLGAPRCASGNILHFQKWAQFADMGTIRRHGYNLQTWVHSVRWAQFADMGTISDMGTICTGTQGVSLWVCMCTGTLGVIWYGECACKHGCTIVWGMFVHGCGAHGGRVVWGVFARGV